MLFSAYLCMKRCFGQPSSRVLMVKLMQGHINTWHLPCIFWRLSVLITRSIIIGQQQYSRRGEHIGVEFCLNSYLDFYPCVISRNFLQLIQSFKSWKEPATYFFSPVLFETILFQKIDLLQMTQLSSHFVLLVHLVKNISYHLKPCFWFSAKKSICSVYILKKNRLKKCRTEK